MSEAPRFKINSVTSVIVAKAVGGEKVLNVQLVDGSLLPHLVNRLPKIPFCAATPLSNRVSAVVVDWPSKGNPIPFSWKIVLVACRKSKTFATPT